MNGENKKRKNSSFKILPNITTHHQLVGNQRKKTVLSNKIKSGQGKKFVTLFSKGTTTHSRWIHSKIH